MKKKRCFFIGHRDVSEKVYPALLAEVERHIVELDVTEFIVGHYGEFDRLAAKAVIFAKQAHPNVSLLLLLPYHPAERPVKIPASFDGAYYPSNMETVPRRVAIVRANRYMVDHVDCLIACAWHPASNARELVNYARTQQKRRELSVSVLTFCDEHLKL